jgi:uncharacterized protein
MILDEKYRQMLLQIFTLEDTNFEIWAYGSRVNGKAHEGSDLDLVIRGSNNDSVPTEMYITLCEKIKDSNIPILVELRNWASLPQSFHKNIEENYEVLFSQK